MSRLIIVGTNTVRLTRSRDTVSQKVSGLNFGMVIWQVPLVKRSHHLLFPLWKHEPTEVGPTEAHPTGPRPDEGRWDGVSQRHATLSSAATPKSNQGALMSKRARKRRDRKKGVGTRM